MCASRCVEGQQVSGRRFQAEPGLVESGVGSRRREPASRRRGGRVQENSRVRSDIGGRDEMGAFRAKVLKGLLGGGAIRCRLSGRQATEGELFDRRGAIDPCAAIMPHIARTSRDGRNQQRRSQPLRLSIAKGNSRSRRADGDDSKHPARRAGAGRALDAELHCAALSPTPPLVAELDGTGSPCSTGGRDSRSRQRCGAALRRIVRVTRRARQHCTVVSVNPPPARARPPSVSRPLRASSPVVVDTS